ncbi:MAG: 30S ribosomal protein S6, partial [Deltaproteobacteria bacterium]|nr:30S ribosomal protein S6 [Deltaproteobacteria bacterium]
MSLTEYETTVVVRPDISGDAIEATLDRVREAVSKGGGKLIAINHWGKKKLAYPIKKHGRGVYVHANFLGGRDLVAEVERNLRISDTVLRFLTVKLAEHVDPQLKQAQQYLRPQYDAAEEPAEEAESLAAPEGVDEAEPES